MTISFWRFRVIIGRSGLPGAIRTGPLRGFLLVVLVAVFSSLHSSSAIAEKCEMLAPGLVVAYYFDSNDLLVAVERMEGDIRSPEKRANAKAGDLIFNNLNRIVPDNGSNGSDIDISTLGAKTALYLQFVQDEENPKAAICAENLDGVSRTIRTALKVVPKARPICNCQLVWCGRYKCCPC